MVTRTAARKIRIRLRTTAAMGALALALTPATAQATGAAPAVLPATAFAQADVQVVDVTSLSQIPGAGSHARRDSNSKRIVYRARLFTNNLGGQCLDGDTVTLGHDPAKVQLWHCTGAENQVWYWSQVADEPDGRYNIQNSVDLQCLEGDSAAIGTDGAKAQLRTCNRGSNQVWVWDGDAGTLKNLDGGQCLDGDTVTIGHDGAKVQLWHCTGVRNQAWTFRA
ncbi:RICIN domain-containing protein [Kitasatospora sp. MBT63]|uniref:RICIN domain-containing protein n=1 Tax=Kitasatospora sp. MBT63 TaxID=1444768 RepID=UPI00053A9459|nr:RICIN domain-containing protein [Kitasatospora sp. MBT63]